MPQVVSALIPVSPFVYADDHPDSQPFGAFKKSRMKRYDWMRVPAKLLNQRTIEKRSYKLQKRHKTQATLGYSCFLRISGKRLLITYQKSSDKRHITFRWFLNVAGHLLKEGPVVQYNSN